jgi:Ser/Thr protein kinase RdoA (MazF antagonist)
VLHWIAGNTQARITSPMAEALGAAVGGLDEQLTEFYHRHALDYSQYQDSLWNVINIPRLVGDLEHLRGRLGDVYRIIKETIAHFVSTFSSWSQTLLWSVIHNDINLGNVLYDAHMQLVGIIDFGEICHTYRVCEVGVALAYIMQTSQKDYWQAGQYFIRGYTQRCALSVAEQSVLLLVVKLRLCITIIYNTMQQYGGRALTVSQARFIRNASALLTQLAETTASEFQERIFVCSD